MAHPLYSSDEIVERGQALYDQQIREQGEPRYTGKFLVLDTETGEVEIDADSVATLDRATAKHPDPACTL